MNQATTPASTPLKRSPWLLLLALGVALVLQGCPASGIYRTARTLEEGQNDWGLTFTATRYSVPEHIEVQPDGSKKTIPEDAVTLPNIIPEVHGHIALAENIEVGGRIALMSGLTELDFKYRFIGGPNEKLHIAVQPAVGYRAAIGSEGPQFTLPLIATYDVASRLSVTVAPYGSYLDLTPLGDDTDDNPFSGTWITAGAVVGLEFRGDVFHIMPSVDISRTAVDFTAEQKNADGTVKTSINDNLSYLVFGLTFGWTQGKELQKLEKMDTKLDRIEKKLDAK